MIHVLALVTTTPGSRAKFLAEFQRLVPLVLVEAGCLDYGPTIDAVTNLPNQALLGDNSVLIVEKWQDLESLQRHLVAPHMVEYRERVKPLLESVKLQVLTPA